MAVLGFIVLIELAFFLSNMLKFDDGGWLPIAVGDPGVRADERRGRKAGAR